MLFKKKYFVNDNKVHERQTLEHLEEKYFFFLSSKKKEKMMKIITRFLFFCCCIEAHGDKKQGSLMVF